MDDFDSGCAFFLPQLYLIQPLDGDKCTRKKETTWPKHEVSISDVLYINLD